MDKKQELKYNKWKDYLTNTRDRTNYSIRRMDLLIISISGAGLFIIFETLREFKTGDVKIDHTGLLLFSGVSFLLAIGTNFISQVTGFKANNYEEEYVLLELEKIEEGKEKGKLIKKNNEEQDKLNAKIEKFNKSTDKLNYASIALMFIGLLLLAIFNFFLF